MSDRTTSPVAASTPITSLEQMPMYLSATVEQQKLLRQDMEHCTSAEGIPVEEYLEGLATWGGDAASYLTECGVPVEVIQGMASAPSPTGPAESSPTAAAEQAAADEERQRAEASACLKALVSAFRKGERAYRAVLLEAGRLADEYIRRRLALGDKRAAAVQTVEGKLAEYSSGTVDVNELVACWQAHRLLADEPGVKADAVPYGHLRDGWRNLVQRQQKDTPAECWVLLPGFEQESCYLFVRAVKDGLSKQAVQESVRDVQRRYIMAESAAAKAAAAKAEADAKAKATEEALAREARQKAEAEARKAEVAAQQAAHAKSAEEAKGLVAAAEAAKQALADKQRQESAAAAAAEQAAREKARAESAAKEAAKRETKAATVKGSKPKPATEGKPATATAPEPVVVTGNLLDAGKTGTPKDVASMLAGIIQRHDEPDTVLEALLAELRGSAELGKSSLRAVEAALAALAPPSRGPNPVEVVNAMSKSQPSRNGTPAAAAA